MVQEIWVAPKRKKRWYIHTRPRKILIGAGGKGTTYKAERERQESLKEPITQHKKVIRRLEESGYPESERWFRFVEFMGKATKDQCAGEGNSSGVDGNVLPGTGGNSGDSTGTEKS